MCGIAGYILLKESAIDMSACLLNASKALHHRGPDDYGIWIDQSTNIGFVQTRLSILDLSPAGHQPMHSSSSRFCIVYNGEIYNFLEVKGEVEKHRNVSWRGHSDTEIILEAFEVWGVLDAIKKFKGMFAIAVFDLKTNKLWLARDIAGEKPLYYGFVGDVFLFTSELKVLKAIPNKLDINYNAVNQYFHYGYINAPSTIFQDIYKVEPGTALEYDLNDIKLRKQPTPHPYWKLPVIHPNKALSFDNALTTLENKLQAAVARQVVADVKVGAFLSGGTDSSLVVAMMKRLHANVETFSIGFKDELLNEAPYAKKVAEHLGTIHHELYVDEADMQNVVFKLGAMYSEPFADSSAIPTYLVSKLAKQQVTVALSGDGADELFCGYQRYLLTMQALFFQKFCPQVVAKIMYSVSSILLQHSSKCKKLSAILSFCKRAASVLMVPYQELYLNIIALFDMNENVCNFDGVRSKNLDISTIENMMAYDFNTYLPGDILTKVDTAAMANSLEVRAPFLDKDVIEFAQTLPLYFKRSINGVQKHILKEILYKYVPKNILERPKQGFAVPLGKWLKGPLYDLANESVKYIAEKEFINKKLVLQTWNDFQTNDGLQYKVWSLIMFKAWYDEFMR